MTRRPESRGWPIKKTRVPVPGRVRRSSYPGGRDQKQLVGSDRMPQSLAEERRNHKPYSSRAASEWARGKVQANRPEGSQPGQPLSSNAWMGVRANVEEREKPQTRDDEPWPKAHLRVFEIKKIRFGRSPRTSTIHSPASARIKKRNVRHRVRVFAAVLRNTPRSSSAPRACG